MIPQCPGAAGFLLRGFRRGGFDKLSPSGS
jgi:hypothetical protein